jgi:hypothetical protein
VLIRHLHEAAEAHDEVEAELVLEKLVQRLVAKAAIGEDRDLHAGQDLPETFEEHVLVLVPPALQLGLHDGLPEQGRGPAVLGDEVEGDGGLVVRVELGPVERHHDLGPRPDDERNPGGEEVADIDPSVGEEPVDLLDRMLGVAVLRYRQRPSERGHRELSAEERPYDRVPQRGDALGVARGP